MPTYTYQCAHCAHQFDQLQQFSEEPLRQCPACDNAALKRKIGAGAGLVFKGSGFYITDYARKGAAPKAESGSADKPAKTGTETKSKDTNL